MQGSCIETSLRGRGDRCEAENEQQISAHAVVFVDGLCIVHASIDCRGVILGYSDSRLNSEQDICDQSKDAVRGSEVGARVGELVVFDYYKPGEEGKYRGAIYHGVDVGTEVLLFRGVRWLED